MKIRITIQAINDDDQVLAEERGEIDAGEVTSSCLWYLEKCIVVKTDALFPKKEQS